MLVAARVFGYPSHGGIGLCRPYAANKSC